VRCVGTKPLGLRTKQLLSPNWPMIDQVMHPGRVYYGYSPSSLKGPTSDQSTATCATETSTGTCSRHQQLHDDSTEVLQSGHA
jgi:hypothetical protein